MVARRRRDPPNDPAAAPARSGRPPRARAPGEATADAEKTGAEPSAPPRETAHRRRPKFVL